VDFERLIVEHQDRVFRLCASMLGDRREAEDAAQEVFLKAFRSMDRFKGEAAVSTWLHPISRPSTWRTARCPSSPRTTASP